MGTQYNTISNVDIATFVTSMGNGSAGKPLAELTAEITPTQNLNGYAKPWPGGAGKNLLPNPSVENGWQHGSFNPDGGIVPATNGEMYYEPFVAVPSGATKITFTVVLDPAPTPPTGDYWKAVCFYDSSQNFLGRYTSAVGPSGTFNVPSGAVLLRAACSRCDIVSHLQLEAGATATDYEPYENICPITGQTSVSVYLAGESLLPFPSAENGWKPGFFSSVGSIVNPSNVYREMYNEEYVPIPDGAQIITLTVRISAETYKNWTGVCFYDENKTFILRRSAVTETTSYSIPENAAYFRVSCYTYNMVEFLNLEYGTTQKIVMQLGQTVYGGTIDVVSGTLTLTHRMVRIDQNANRLSVGTSSSTGLYYCSCVPISAEDAGINTAGGGGLLCDRFNVSTRADIGNTYLTGGGITLVFVLPDQTIDNVAKAGVWLTSNPVTWVYELAEPKTVQLTGRQINTLMGQNNVWASTGKIKTLKWQFTTYDLLQVFINGVDITGLIAFNGWERQRNDVDSPDAGRTLDGKMHRARVTTKMRFNVTCRPLLSGEISTLEGLIMPEYVTVKVIGDPYYGTWEKLCYVNNTSAKYLIRKKDGRQYWGGVTFPIIEV